MLILFLFACTPDLYVVQPSIGTISGNVIDLNGKAIANSEIRISNNGVWGNISTYTDNSGYFQLDNIQGNQWIQAEASGYHGRVRPSSLDQPVNIRLSPDNGEIVLQIAGALMIGQNYYTEGMIRENYETLDVPRLVDGISPLFYNSDLLIASLESPITYDGESHPKEYTWYTTPEAIAALNDLGALNLATSHIYDFLDQGVEDTLNTLNNLNIPFSGAGLNETDAWQPVLIDVSGIIIGMIGCTTISGVEEEISLVAEANKGGAAKCSNDELENAISELKHSSDLVLVQINAGEESKDLQNSYNTKAIELGADLIINTNAQKNGGFALSDSIIASPGALLYSQNLWDALTSILVTVHIDTNGNIVRLYGEPLILNKYSPVAVTGFVQTIISRQVLELSDLNFVLDNGALELDLEGISKTKNEVLNVGDGRASWSYPYTLQNGWFKSISGVEHYRLGRDLLMVGDFEDIDVDDQHADPLLWSINSTDEQISDIAAYEGHYGLRLKRSYSQTSDVAVNPQSRIPITNKELTISGYSKGSEFSVQISWYDKMTGSSKEKQTFTVSSSDDWTPFVFNIDPPNWAIAAGLYLRLSPPKWAMSTTDIDSIRLIEWEESPKSYEALDMLQVQGFGEITLESREL